ncbi:MAG: thermonuclease family protein [Rhodobacteraceae bacterium]|nr:thermonuclease family protein [Paracoccaceae bacterium]
MAAAHSPPPDPGRLCGRCWVMDGDTIVIGGQNIRIAGIDAPELDHPYGYVARSALIRLCRGHEVTATVTGGLSYGRLVAVCHLPDGRDIAAEMVRMGMALDWPKHSGGRYRGLEPPGARRRLWRIDARQKGRMPPPARPGGAAGVSARNAPSSR